MHIPATRQETETILHFRYKTAETELNELPSAPGTNTGV